MSTISSDARAFVYPQVRRLLKSNKTQKDGQFNVCWSAKFWPYDVADQAPIFCLSNKSDMTVCRITQTGEASNVEVIRQLEVTGPDQEVQDYDPNNDDQYCSCAWAYISKDEPLLLGAGNSGFIRVFDIVKGCLKTTLIGHGNGVINELATHPKYPWIFASASLDKSIRIWDLRRWNSKHESPTIIICGAGNGHKESVLSVGWHDSGRYLISGGFDNRVCVWTIPDLSPESTFWEEISPTRAKRRSDQVRIIHFPHFVTLAVHRNYIDCVRFWGDNILSRATEEHKIVLWRMTGFNSRLQPPDDVLAPKAEEHLDTRNGFIRQLVSEQNGVTKIITDPVYHNVLPYQRLLEFQAPHTLPFFIRFDILKRSPTHPGIHDVLAIGNTRSTVQFWDLEALERGYDYNTGSSGRGGRRTRGQGSRRGVPQSVLRGGRRAQLSLERSESASASLASVGTGTGTGTGASTPASLSPSQSSPPLRSNSTDATSLMSDSFQQLGPGILPLPNLGNSNTNRAVEPAEDRTRFPLKHHNTPLKKAHHAVVFNKEFEKDFTARGVAWSNCGRWCVVAGETVEMLHVEKGKERKMVQIGAAVLLGRDLP